MTTSNNSKIFLRLIWFLLLEYSPTKVLCLPWNNHQSKNQVLGNHCVCLLTIWMWTKKLLTVKLELLNLSARQLNIEIHHGHWKKKQKGHSKISEEIRKSLYNWIVYHPQVMQSPIANDFMKVKIYGYTEPQLVTKTLFHISVKEIHKNLFIVTKDGRLK